MDTDGLREAVDEVEGFALGTCIVRRNGQKEYVGFANSPSGKRYYLLDPITVFGVNVSEGRGGAVQVQGAAFRLWCRNGATIRVCDGRKHRIRRPINRPDGQRQFLRRIGEFAEEAWRQHSDNEAGLVRLTRLPLDVDRRGALRTRLRQAPFFLSARIAGQVLNRLMAEIEGSQDSPSFYDLFNAMTYLGTHDEGLSLTYRSRLRFGAGEFSRRETRVCRLCRQPVVS